jgi:hypothetical protein
MVRFPSFRHLRIHKANPKEDIVVSGLRGGTFEYRATDPYGQGDDEGIVIEAPNG